MAVKNVLIDFFGGNYQIENMNILTMTRIIVVTALTNKKLILKQYETKVNEALAYQGEMAPVDIGPTMTLELKRVKKPDSDIMKEALKNRKLKAASLNKKRNISTNIMGEKKGKLFVQQQSIDTLALRRFTKRRKMGEHTEEKVSGEEKTSGEETKEQKTEE